MGSQNSPPKGFFPPLFFVVQHAGVSSDTGPPVEVARLPARAPPPVDLASTSAAGESYPLGVRRRTWLSTPYRGEPRPTR